MEGDAVIGYSRLLPTPPALLSDVLPQLCEVERRSARRSGNGPATAWRARTRAKGRVVNPVSIALLTGIVEWGLAHGVNSLLLQMPTLYMIHVIQLHFRPQPLGLPFRSPARRSWRPPPGSMPEPSPSCARSAATATRSWSPNPLTWWLEDDVRQQGCGPGRARRTVPAVRELVDTVGDPLMRAAIDLLLLEVARALAETSPQERAGGA